MVCKRIEEYALIHSSKVHTNCSDFSRILANRDNKIFFSMLNSSSFIKTTKSKGYIFIEEINMAILGIIQSQFIIPSL